MKFPPPSGNTHPPRALQDLDNSLGFQTQEAYQAAVDVAPHLGGLAVVLSETGSTFYGSKLGLAGSYIGLHPDAEHYNQLIKKGVATQRMGEYSSLYRAKGIVPSVNELIVATLLHEMGHANDFNSYITRANGDTHAAFEIFSQVRDSELASLPLKTATSRAVSAWENNSDGYQDKLRSQGMTDERLAKMVESNIQAYGALTCERLADQFALGVLATVHA